MINFISIVLVRVPGAYLTSRLYPGTLYPMGIATALGFVLSVVICAAVFCWLRRRREPEDPLST